jgi:hypothetical protein
MMVILSVPDDGYSERILWWLFWAFRITIIRYAHNNHHQVRSE